jgi:hypothetical protein
MCLMQQLETYENNNNYIHKHWSKFQNKINWNEKSLRNTINIKTPLVTIWPTTSTTPTSNFKNNKEHQKQEHTKWGMPKTRTHRLKNIQSKSTQQGMP